MNPGVGQSLCFSVYRCGERATLRGRTPNKNQGDDKGRLMFSGKQERERQADMYRVLFTGT